MCIRDSYGGDEFMIILTEANVDEAMKTAERIRAHVADVYCSTLDKILQVTLSIGVIQSESQDKSVTSLLSRVDSALYEAKHAGRDQVYCMQPQPNTAT